MKKTPIIIGLLVLLMVLSSCANKTPTPVSETKLTIQDYYPFSENKKYVYEGQGNEYASYIVFTDFIQDNRVQLRSNNGGTEQVKVLENKNGELTLLLSRGECYYRENFTQSPSTNGEIILKEPLTKGTTWTLPDSRKRSITNVDVEISTPLGKYKTLEVTTEGKEDKIIDYYAPQVGLVKSVFTSLGTEVSSTLSKIEENAAFTQSVKFYYPNINDDKLYYVEKKLSFLTNDITRTAFQNEFQNVPNAELGKVLSPNAKMKSLYLNKDNMVYVDFSKEFVSEMNAGSGYESMILQSITNTLGQYYGVEKVYITIEGSPYSSGHIAMKKGEAFSVNLNHSVPLL